MREWGVYPGKASPFQDGAIGVDFASVMSLVALGIADVVVAVFLEGEVLAGARVVLGNFIGGTGDLGVFEDFGDIPGEMGFGGVTAVEEHFLRRVFCASDGILHVCG